MGTPEWMTPSRTSAVSIIMMCSISSFLFILKFYLCIWLHRVLVVPCGIFIASWRIFQLCHRDSLAVAPGLLSCTRASGVLVFRSGKEPLSLPLQGGFLTAGPPEKSPIIFKSLKYWYFSIKKFLILVIYIQMSPES